jgi:hypothetical protein
MSALGQKQTSDGSAPLTVDDVRFTPESGHSAARLECPLCAKSGHPRAGPVRVRWLSLALNGISIG